MGWYNISFFRGAGFDVWLEADGITTGTNIGGAGGTDVVEAMLDIAGHPGFVSLSDADFITYMNYGTLIAGINGIWNADRIQHDWGANFAVAPLPTFTVAGSQVQMGGIIACVLVGVNAHSEQPELAMLLAEWITNYDSQVTRAIERGEAPTNLAAATSSQLQGQANPALSALSAQSAYSAVFSAGGNFWTPMETLGATIAQGNPFGFDLQELLDNAVASITS